MIEKNFKFLTSLSGSLLGLLALFFLEASPVLAASVGQNPCTKGSISEIVRPFRNNSSAPTFQYKFSYLAPKHDSLPTIIVIPGGPGGTSIEKEWPQFPEDFGVLATDPRGVGCNQLSSDLPAEFYNSQLVAEDIVAAIQQKGLKNYILYGVSYGTLVGTLVAHKIQNEKMPQPGSVIFEGVLGRHFAEGEEGKEKLIRWARVKNELSSDTLKVLLQSATPFGLDALKWGSTIDMLMSIGIWPGKGDLLLELLNTLGGSKEYSLESLRQVVSNEVTDKNLEPAMAKFWTQIACREIVENTNGVKSDFILNHGNLVSPPAESNVCAQIPMDRPYDSRNYQLNVPTFYFVGENDVATPVWQAEYHFMNQQKNSRALVRVEGGGHNPLTFNLSDCARSVMTEIVAGAEKLESSLLSCQLKSKIIRAQP